MSVTEANNGQSAPVEVKKRKYEQSEELEVRLDAPEPPSKKALRKAKKAKISEDDEHGIHVDRKSQIAQGKDDGKVTPPVFKEQPKRTGFGIWIGNLAFTTTAENLLSFLTSEESNPIAANEIARLNLPKGVPRNGKQQNKGFAYVDFLNQNAIEKALLLSEKLLTGRRVLIKDAKNFEGRPKPAEVKVEISTSKRIFVGNLAFDATKDALRQHFEVCGPVADVFLTTFEDSGKCKGYGWVTFEDVTSAENAMRGWIEDTANESGKAAKRRLWVNKIGGRLLRLEYAEDATTRYNKRYGKDAKKTEADSLVLGEVADNSSNVGVKDAGGPKVKREGGREKRSKYNRPSPMAGKYDDSTVAKLKGSIVKSEGTKKIFSD